MLKVTKRSDRFYVSPTSCAMDNWRMIYLTDFIFSPCIFNSSVCNAVHKLLLWNWYAIYAGCQDQNYLKTDSEIPCEQDEYISLADSYQNFRNFTFSRSFVKVKVTRREISCFRIFFYISYTCVSKWKI